MSDRTALYRHFGPNDELLYVGISFSAVSRMSQHASQSHWSASIARMTVEWFDSRDAAINAETAAIFKEKPLHNRKRPTPKGMKRVKRYEYPRAAGCCNYELRDFWWLAGWLAPIEAEAALVACVRDAAHAIQVSLTGMDERAVAKLLYIEPDALSDIKHGRTPIPDDLVEPFCTVTGCALLRQVCPPPPRPPLDNYYDPFVWLTETQKIEYLAAELRQWEAA